MQSGRDGRRDVAPSQHALIVVWSDIARQQTLKTNWGGGGAIKASKTIASKTAASNVHNLQGASKIAFIGVNLNHRGHGRGG